MLETIVLTLRKGLLIAKFGLCCVRKVYKSTDISYLNI